MSLQTQIVIIGAGIAGLTMAIKLKKMGCSDFKIIETASEVGGTWRDNIYPGCSSDVPIHLYSLSSDLNPNWTHTHASQPDILQYWVQLTTKYGLHSNIIFDHKVVSAEWNGSGYDILTQTGDGTRVLLTAKILVSAVGRLGVPRFPNIPGVAEFRGVSFHSGHWDTSVSLAGKRVAVVGNGPSATQFVPVISQDLSVQITQYCRSPRWLAPPAFSQYSSAQRWLFRHSPRYLRAFRSFQFFWNELVYFAIFGSNVANYFVEQYLTTYMKRVAPPEYMDNVIPSGSALKVGCKRVVYDTNYLASSARPNLSLTWESIESIHDSGIVTKSGRTEFDVIIYSTGYIADDYFISIKGNAGQLVAEYYVAQRGPTAYLGTTLPGFANLFFISGGNTATGSSSVLLAIEIQAEYIIQLIQPILTGDISSLEVTIEATDAYNRHIQAKLAGFVWSKCSSWYRTGGNGKIYATFPGPMTLFWWWLRRPNWDHYTFNSAAGWKPQRAVLGPYSIVLLGCLTWVVVAVSYLWLQRRGL
ncbi:hypothetical protein B0H16DRAFT_649863 [Mycena metata]|uniref:Uncharacterized protein n=1 Tax=Mycena metata TaxID=1033252 RepID=A0AAD7J6N5_9AGAR|nr:hypothetical protein B0H16DRAFT_649863 [Mycena metata]